MKKVLLMLALGMFLFSSCRDQFIDGNENWDDFTDTEEPTENGGEEGMEGSLTLYKVDADAITKIKDFEVSGNNKALQADIDKHNRMWNHLVELIPTEYRDKIAQFEVFAGGNELLGYVEPLDYGDLSKWKFAMAIDFDGSVDKIDFKNLFTLVTLHEYGHVLTLNDNQISLSSPQACNSYHTGEGCSHSDSYINKLFNLGWADIIEEHDDPYDTYEKYPTRFVSDYAATNPGEDIAEVFTYFVAADDRPSGSSIADKKIKQMFDNDALARLRNQIRASADMPTLKAISNRTFEMPKHLKRRCSHTKRQTLEIGRGK